MTGDTSTLVIQFVFLAGFYRRTHNLSDALQSATGRNRKSEILPMHLSWAAYDPCESSA